LDVQSERDPIGRASKPIFENANNEGHVPEI
jgi:hypothetical protein